MAVDTSSIVLAIISIVGTFAVAAFTAWTTYFSDRRATRRESEKLLAKYRDPLLLAAQDLQSRLYNICEKEIYKYYPLGGRERDNLLLYTAYLVGQYLSWSFILRRQAQFLRFATDRENAALTDALGAIAFEFSTDEVPEDAAPFMLWRGEQSAIGEIMSVDLDSGNGGYCLGYAEFEKRLRQGRRDLPEEALGLWTGVSTTSASAQIPEDSPLSPILKTMSPAVFSAAAKDAVAEPEEAGEPQEKHKRPHGDKVVLFPKGKSMALAPEFVYEGDFAPWFRSIILSTAEVSNAMVVHDNPVPDQRIRRLQHLLLDLMTILDPKHLRAGGQFTKHCHRARHCTCNKCKELGSGRCPCGRRQCQGPAPKEQV